jgi:hypothetical protein
MPADAFVKQRRPSTIFAANLNTSTNTLRWPPGGPLPAGSDRLLDHLVGGGQQRFRDGQAEGLGERVTSLIERASCQALAMHKAYLGSDPMISGALDRTRLRMS